MKRSSILAVLAYLGTVAIACGQAPTGHIASIFPAGAGPGQSVQVTVLGTDLDEVTGVRVAGEGVSGRLIKVTKGTTALVEISVEPGSPPGQRDFRLVSSGGLTNRARFVVGQFRETLEKEPNSRLNEAEPLPALPVVVNGQIFQADKDVFRFSARAGQTIVCRVEAQQLLPFIADAVPGWFQAVATLYDSSGSEVAYVDDFRFLPDPVIIQQIPRDGEYKLEIHDALYRGREDFVYRLTVGEMPYLTHIYPLGAPAGSKTQVELFGANLSARQVGFDLATATPSQVRYVGCRREGLLSNVLPFAVGGLPEVSEAEPNSATARAQTIRTPATVNGRIDAAGDIDCFAVSAAADESLVIDVEARRLLSPLDSVVRIFDMNGQQVAENDDFEDESHPEITHHADSRVVHTFKSAGRYYVTIEDVQGKGGAEYAYRLELRPPHPDFELRVTPDNPRLGQGSTAVLNVQAIRRDGFQGPVSVRAEKLPDGFSATVAEIPAGVNETILTLTASRQASLGTYSPTVVGQANIAGRTVSRAALPVEDCMQAFYYHHLMPTRELLLTVVEPGPFRLIPVMPAEGYIRFGAGRTAFLDVKVERTPAAKGPIRLGLQNAPKGVRATAVTIATDQDQAQLEIRYPNQLPANVVYNLIVSGSIRVGAKTMTTVSPAVLTLGPSAKPPQTARSAKPR